MAKPTKDGKGWALRQSFRGERLYVSGESSASKAKEAMQRLIAGRDALGRPKGLGPQRTTVAQALQDYAMERLQFLKGANQEVRRINAYLRPAGLATLKAVRLSTSTTADAKVDSADSNAAGGKQKCYFALSLEQPLSARKVPQGLGKHRDGQARETAAADSERERIARMPMSEVQSHHIQKLMDEVRKVREPATVQLERAVLRRLFNHARSSWHWSEPGKNPAIGITMPKVDNARDRVMSHEEERRLDEAIKACHNQLVGPTLVLLRETAMRTSEPLEHARWGDVDWDARVIKLQDSKNDKRDVPLSPDAVAALRELAEMNPLKADERIIQMSYDALAAAWRRACQRANVADLHLHDLRHTAATRMALKSGNVFLVKALTGHKTMSQLERYVNVKASDVVAFMHGPKGDGAMTMLEAVNPEFEIVPESASAVVANVVKVDFRARRAA
jgi:integrase